LGGEKERLEGRHVDIGGKKKKGAFETHPAEGGQDKTDWGVWV